MAGLPAGGATNGEGFKGSRRSIRRAGKQVSSSSTTKRLENFRNIPCERLRADRLSELMSAGPKRTCAGALQMSAFGRKAEKHHHAMAARALEGCGNMCMRRT